MKATIISGMSLFFISLFLFSSSFAQQEFGRQSAYRSSSDRLSSVFLLADSKTHGNHGNESIAVSEKTMKHFNKKFHNPVNVIWEQIDNNFLATFIKNEVTTKSLFDKKGRLIYIVDFCTEKDLPNNVKNLVMLNYRNSKITSVAKVEEQDRKIWVIKLAGIKNYISARVEDGEIEETENFKRAD